MGTHFAGLVEPHAEILTLLQGLEVCFKFDCLSLHIFPRQMLSSFTYDVTHGKQQALSQI